MRKATVYMTDGEEYEVEYDSVEESYTTVYFQSNKETTMFSKFNLLFMTLEKEQKNE